MIGCLWTCIRKQPIIALYFESENELKLYDLEASLKDLHASMRENRHKWIKGGRSRGIRINRLDYTKQQISYFAHIIVSVPKNLT